MAPSSGAPPGARASDVVVRDDSLRLVAGWLGVSDVSLLAPAPAEEAVETRPEGLGLGASYLPHSQAVVPKALDARLGAKLRGSARRRGEEPAAGGRGAWVAEGGAGNARGSGLGFAGPAQPSATLELSRTLEKEAAAQRKRGEAPDAEGTGGRGGGDAKGTGGRGGGGAEGTGGRGGGDAEGTGGRGGGDASAGVPVLTPSLKRAADALAARSRPAEEGSDDDEDAGRSRALGGGGKVATLSKEQLLKGGGKRKKKRR